MYLHMSIITTYRDDEYLPVFNALFWSLGGGLYIGGAIIYMLRVPERWFPNKFDFFVTIFINSPLLL